MHRVIALLKRFRSDERGVFAVIFGVMAVVLVALAGAAVDYTSMETARTRAQIALDSAALGLAPTIYDDPTKEALMASALAVVNERLNDPAIVVDITDAVVDKPNGTLRFTGTVTAPMAFVTLVGIPTLTANMVSEATKGSVNLEVAVSLDVSGSMEDYIEDLEKGLDGLIGLVVNDVQEPTYSKMAIVPWSTVVYAGDYADDLRGAVPDARPITSIYWSGPLVDITNATRANPVVITANNHGYSNGDYVRITGVTGMTQLNNNFYRVANRTTNTFSLQTTGGSNVNGTGYNNFTGGTSNNNDKVRKCLYWVSSSSSCRVVVRADNHGFQTGDFILTNDNISGSTFDDKLYEITRRDANTFTLDGVTSTSTTNPTLATGGGAWCTKYGCEWYRFQRNNRSDFYLWRITDCVTERATDTYSDVPPSTTLLGANYNSTDEDGVVECDSGLDQAFTPLTSDKDVLFAESDALDDYLYTAGHLGTAWAWYLLAPDWGYLWPEPENVPSAYNAENTLKVAILMTDGEYNRQFCNGVYEGTIEDCDAPDGSTTQARALCTAMKAAGVVVYTVGFNIAANSSPAITMQQCASDAGKYFQPATGDELVDDFDEIGRAITDLRLSL